MTEADTLRAGQALTLPIRLGADCPPANRFGTDPPLWSSVRLSISIVLSALS